MRTLKQCYDDLLKLKERLPEFNDQSGWQELSSVFSEYGIILDEVGRTNEKYELWTSSFRAEISDISSEIARARSSKSQRQRDAKFRLAGIYLSDDIQELAEIIKFVEKFD